MYTSAMECYWKVVGPPGQQLKLETIFFDNGGDCSKGTINIYDGPNQGSTNTNNLCFHDTIPIKSTGNSVYLNLWRNTTTTMNYNVAFRIRISFEGI